MKILVSNDDGYFSPGITQLAEALARRAEVTVVAPERDRSGASNSLTLDRPLIVRRAANGYYSVNGTPTDCVHIAVTGLLDFTPDIIVSGVNLGANMGDDTIYSGTVAVLNYHMRFQLDFIKHREIIEDYHNDDNHLLILDRYFYCSLAYLNHAVSKKHDWEMVCPIFYGFYRYTLLDPQLVIWLKKDPIDEIQECYKQELEEWDILGDRNLQLEIVPALKEGTFTSVEALLKDKGYLKDIKQ